MSGNGGKPAPRDADRSSSDLDMLDYAIDGQFRVPHGSGRHTVQAINRERQHTNVSTAKLRRMVGPDVHRPGSARYRLLEEQIPIWAIIGHLKAIAAATDQPYFSEEVILQTASDYDVKREAVLAALLYYDEHHGAIDALLETHEVISA